eukprot:7384070-Prymnesium_polylepis.2
MTSTCSGSSSSSIVPRSTFTTSDSPCAATIVSACAATPVASTAKTARAPACAAHIARMPVPVPISRTTLPRKCSAAFALIASWYADM